VKITVVANLTVTRTSAKALLAQCENPPGGSLEMTVYPIHLHACPAWRDGKRKGPCKCGAQALYDAWVKRMTPTPEKDVRHCAACGKKLRKGRRTCPCGCWNVLTPDRKPQT
jgi:hypothetical protein